MIRIYGNKNISTNMLAIFNSAIPSSVGPLPRSMVSPSHCENVGPNRKGRTNQNVNLFMQIFATATQRFAGAQFKVPKFVAHSGIEFFLRNGQNLNN